MAARQAYTRNGQAYTGRNMKSNTAGSMYVYGNAVPKPVYEPRRHEELPQEPRRKASRQVQRNRKQALHMSPAYVIFLTIAAIMALVVCVYYVQLQSRITEGSKTITAMQEELANMKEENNTRQNAVMDSVNLDEVREIAQTELGMVYASPEQIVEYDNPATDYVKQYEKIPEDGVLAQSDRNAE